MIRVGIMGATGYTAVELIKLLLRHPEVEIVALTTRQDDQPHVSSVHRQLTNRLDLTLDNLTPQLLAEKTDCVFSCLPHAASAPIVMQLLDAGVKVVDFSADYRLDDPVLYSNWYKVEHPDPERLPNVPYGLPEFFKEQIKDAPVVANPGCFPTGAVLALAPLLVDKIIEPDSIIIDSKSGVSGAGRNPKLGTHYPECNESIAAYSVGQHRHMPEIDFVLGKVTGKNVETIFTPHLVPMDRGILTTAYAKPNSMVNENDLIDLYREFYRDAPFVRVVDHLPATKDTMNTNYCDVTLRVVRGRIIVISSIDNLVKGASGAAVQNMNVMYGFEETTALI